MPQNESYWNPYRLVGPQAEPERSQPYTHEKFQGISGRIQGKLRALTPIFVGGSRQSFFFQSNGKYCIPATSFKGMLRSLVEVIGNGCAIVGRGQNPCRSTDRLCIACSMFGMSLSGGKNILFQGKVYVSDLYFLGKAPPIKPVEVSPGAPKPGHRAFYKHPCTRKFYYHQRNPWSNVVNAAAQRNMIRKIRPLPADSEFSLDIRCENMSVQELGILLYCLELEQNLCVEIDDKEERIVLRGDMRHKIGGCKPLGYGSVAVEIEPAREDFYEPKQRYRRLGKEPLALSEEIWKNAQEEKEKYHIGGYYDNQILSETRAMMLFPDNKTDPRNFRYPDYQWFQANSQIPLKKIYRRVTKGNTDA